MTINNTQIPNNVTDLLMDECVRRRALEKAVRTRFLSCGYREVSPAGLEFYDTYSSGVGARSQEEMVKTFDSRGRILVLRPEFTTPIARLAATKLRDEALPLRLCYVGTAYANPAFQSARQLAEFTQAGVELLGCEGARADAEVVALALTSMRAAGLTDYMVEIGQVDFFKGLMEEAGLDEATTELVRAYVEEKNMLAIELLLRGNGAAEAAIARIRELPMLFGGAEVFARAEKLSAYPKCREALQNLRAIYDALCACGFENFVTIDLGMVHAIGYYTGMIFRGISASFGQPLLSGGRYDGLMRDFGRPLCAVGFAMGLEHVQEALERQAGPAEAPGLDALLVVGDAPLSRAWQRAEALRAQGQSVELCYAADEAEIAALARARRARRVIREEEAL